MLKILTPAQIKALDAFTIQDGQIPSIDLMERACRAFTKWFTEYFDTQNTIGVVCGTGNNGGDGMGIARILKDLGYAITVWVVRGGVTESIDFKINVDKARQDGLAIIEIAGESDEVPLEGCDVLVDAIFGSGLSRPPTGIYAHVIENMNRAKATRVAVDIPSGLMADAPSPGPVVKAHYTVSFQLPKLTFFLPEYYTRVGTWVLVDIGLHKGFIKESKSSHFYLTQKDPRRILRDRSTFDHKGNYGHALVVAGSFGKMGAALLTARAAMRSGLGLLTARIPRCGYTVLQSGVPEAMVDVDNHEHCLSGSIELDHYTALGIGPGLGKSPETLAAFTRILNDFGKPMVIDADALNMISENRNLLPLVPEGSILTPHPGEFERLVGKWQDDFDRLEKQKRLAAELRSVVILKGAFSSIADPNGRVFFNSTGNPGMATGGSGDVLTGIITGLMAQRYESLQAAQLGVYLHGLSGDLAASEMGINSLIATDLVDFLSPAFRRIRGKSSLF